ncbi:MAG: hypothetical protein EOR30_26210 [Mesorhizobium sp.]|nr:MAG: hypothetical protein EOR14_25555 [Mesorhizobium sp.]RWI63294.1 MAG: hypothetical protein EOR17_29490 [Mesorhizobium sp.]RWI82568.1 MAG: hypothetical protein EOR20_27145 [Mesorhizobium sp.]RWJ46745.1 MAG: hypothetical protein EOR30_26210 [Mesorhizobium sp.]RWJ57484.1 MAG: hypothetical protein EOR32_29310 [Mesorhizobium sp.]
MGFAPPEWRSPRSAKPPATPLLAEYADYLLRHRGNPQVTVHKELQHISKFQDHLTQAGEGWLSIGLTDVDAFLVSYAQRYSRSHVSDVACSIRCFLRFLHWSGRIPVDLSEAVIAPVQPRLERPRRALAWEDVQRLLKAVDRSTPIGLRDYALLLMMSTYGLGAGEAIRLRFDDVDWEAGTLSVVRPKTGTAFTLPLLPAVAKAVACYLHDGRAHGHTHPASVRADACAVRPLGRFKRDTPHHREACKDRGDFGTVPRQPRSAPFPRGTPDRSRHAAACGVRASRASRSGITLCLCADRDGDVA